MQMEFKTYSLLSQLPVDSIRRMALAMILTVVAMTANAYDLRNKYDKEHPLNISCDIDFYPYEARDDKGEPTGFNIDVMTSILNELHVNYKFIMRDKKNAVNNFEANETNLMLTPVVEKIPGVYYGKFELEQFRVVLVCRKEVAPISSLKELPQHEVVIAKEGGYPAEKAFEQGLLTHDQVQYRSIKVAIEGLANDEIDYLIAGEKTVQALVKRYGLENDIIVKPIDLPAGKMRFASRDRQLIEALDDFCTTMEQNGKLMKLSNKWFSETKEKNNASPIIVLVFVAIFVALCILLLVNRVVNSRLKRTLRNTNDTNNIVRKALEMGGNYIICTDLDKNRVRNLYGDLIDSGEMDDHEFYRKVHPDDMEGLKNGFYKLLGSNGEIVHIKYRLNRGTASEPDWHIMMGQMAVEVDKGKPTNVFTTLSDVTHEEMHEQQERNISETYKHIFEMSIAGLALYDPSGKLISANKMMRRIFDSGELSKSTIEDTLLFDLPAVRGNYSHDDKEGYFVCTRCDVNGNGDVDYIDFRCRPIKNDNGNIIYYMVTTRDMDDERQMYMQSRQQDDEIRRVNSEIQKYEGELKILLEESNMVVWRSNYNKQRVTLYKDLRTFEKRYSFDEFVNLVVDEAQKDGLRHLIDPNINGGQPCNITIEMNRSLDKENKKTWFAINSVPEYDENGQIKGCFGLMRDVDDLMDIQLKMKEETERANDSGRLKSVFLANMTHEIRTPLNAIVGFCDVLQSVDSQEERQEFLKIILNNCNLLMQLINDILVISELDSNGLTLRPAMVDFAEAFNMICISLSQRVQEPGVEFITENPYDRLMVEMDVNRVQQVITNFLTNAVKYTHNGHIKLGYRCQEEGLYIYCEDTGAGIPKDKCDKIFGRFVKLNDYVQGAGLGLSICKAIAEKCGGRIGVDSEEGKGSTFWMWIPIKKNS